MFQLQADTKRIRKKNAYNPVIQSPPLAAFPTQESPRILLQCP